MIKVFAATLCGAVLCVGAGPLLDQEQAELLLRNMPEALAVQRRGGCVSIEVHAVGDDLFGAQLRNGCPKSGSGLIDNYMIDRRTGRIWTGVDNRKYVDSAQLRRLRQRMLRDGGRQVQGERD